MNCAQVERDHIIELYLANRLAEDVRLEWEEHYFHCEPCFEQLQAMNAVRVAVLEAGPPPPIERRRSVWIWGVAALAAAAALLLAVVIPRRPPRVEVARRQPAGESISMSAQLDPPPYSAPVLRGAADAAARDFRAAMQNYSAGDYRASADALRAVVSEYPDSADALYFLGICEILAGDYENGVPRLQRIAQAGDATPYREEAEYYLALVEVKQNRKADALAQLQQVIDLHRDYEQKARELLARIRK